MPRKDPAEKKAYQRTYYERSKAKFIEQGRQWKRDNPAKHSASVVSWMRKNPDAQARARARNVQRLYGVTPEQYDALSASQGGVCAICRRPETHTTKRDRSEGRANRLSVDHEHGTEFVRGLLCHHCNAAIGLMGDNPDRLRAAAAYLERNQST